MADAPKEASTLPPYISNDSSLGGDEFYDAVDNLERRMSSISRISTRTTSIYGSNRSAGSAGVGPPNAEAAELIAHLASGSGRDIKVGEGSAQGGGEGVERGGGGEGSVESKIFGSSTADEGPPGGSLALEVFSTARVDDDLSSRVDETYRWEGDAAASQNSNSHISNSCNDSSSNNNHTNNGSSRRWRPLDHQPPQNVIVMDISSAETTPNTTPGGNRGSRVTGNSKPAGVWGRASSPSSSPPAPQPPPRHRIGPSTTNTNPFAPAVNTGSPTNPFAPGCDVAAASLPATQRGSNPFATDEYSNIGSGGTGDLRPSGGAVVGRSSKNMAMMAGTTAAVAAVAPGNESNSTSVSAKGKAPPLPPRPVSLPRTKGGGSASPVSASSSARSADNGDSSSIIDAAATDLDGADVGSVESSAASVSTTDVVAESGGKGGRRGQVEDENSKFMVVNKVCICARACVCV